MVELEVFKSLLDPDLKFREALDFSRRPGGIGLFYWYDEPYFRRSVFYPSLDTSQAILAFEKAGFLTKPGYGILTEHYHMCEYYHDGKFIPYPDLPYRS